MAAFAKFSEVPRVYYGNRRVSPFTQMVLDTVEPGPQGEQRVVVTSLAEHPRPRNTYIGLRVTAKRRGLRVRMRRGADRIWFWAEKR